MQPTNVIYCRKSSEKGDDYSLDAQVEACKRHVGPEHLAEYRIVSQTFTGTVHLRDRGPLGAALWTAIESGQVKQLICYSIDRLSRAPLRLALQQIDDIVEAGVKLHALDAGAIESSDDIGTIIRSWQSGQERAKIVQRMMGGKYIKARDGKWVGSGRKPYGFTRAGRGKEAHLEHNPDEKAIVELLIDLYLGDPPKSFNYLREELYKRGIPSPSGRGTWYTSTIARVLGNPALIGRFGFSDHLVELPDLKIITDPATWNAIQDRMKSNAQNARRNRRTDYLLTSRLKCICGRSMTASTQTRRGRHYCYYVCGQVQDHRDARTCPVHRVPVARVDAAVWQWVEKHISDEFLSAGIAELEKYELAQAIDPTRLTAIDTEIKRLESHIRALLAQAKETDRPAVVDARNTQLDEDGERIEKLIHERAELSTSLERAAARAAERADLVERIVDMRGKLDGATVAQQAQALGVLGVRVKLVSRSELSKCIKVLISSEIAPPDEVTL